MARWTGGYTWDVPPSGTGAPSRLTVAACQLPVSHDIDLNLGHVLDLVRRAAAAGADVAHFPECALSGYGPATWPDWSQFDWAALERVRDAVCAQARQDGIWVVLGSACRGGPDTRPTNALLVIDRNGQIAGRYDKRRCSANDLRAFGAGDRQLIIEIDGVRCGFLICLDWAFPELWSAYAGEVEVVFHSCVADDAHRQRNHAQTIPPLMQGYAWLNQFAVSVSNSCRPAQDFPSFWVERSGHAGARAVPNETGFVLNALADDPEQDRFFAMVRSSRATRPTSTRSLDLRSGSVVIAGSMNERARGAEMDGHEVRGWIEHGPLTDPGEHAALVAGLPDDVGALHGIVQGLLVHSDWLASYGLDADRMGNVSRTTLPVADRLGDILSRDPSAIQVARPPARRAVGTCRDFALLLCSFLRAKGVPARLRCGFASYFGGGWEDHWVCEHWDARSRRWRRSDAQLDDVLGGLSAIDFDPTDVPDRAFVAAGNAWAACRDSAPAAERHGHGETTGLWFVSINVVRDHLAINGRETSPWDRWRGAPPAKRVVRERDRPTLDRLAAKPDQPIAPLAPDWL